MPLDMGAAELMGGIIPMEYMAIRLGSLNILGSMPMLASTLGSMPIMLIILGSGAPFGSKPMLASILGSMPASILGSRPSYSSSWGQLQALIWQHSWGPWQRPEFWDPIPSVP